MNGDGQSAVPSFIGRRRLGRTCSQGSELRHIGATRKELSTANRAEFPPAYRPKNEGSFGCPLFFGLCGRARTCVPTIGIRRVRRIPKELGQHVRVAARISPRGSVASSWDSATIDRQPIRVRGHGELSACTEFLGVPALRARTLGGSRRSVEFL